MQNNIDNNIESITGSTAIEFLIDPTDGRILEVSGAAAAFYGYSANALRKLRISDINTSPKDETALHMKRAIEGSRSYFRFRHRLASGKVRDVEVNSGPIRIGGRQLLKSVIHDVTGITRTREVRNRLAVALENLSEGIALFGSDDRLVFANQRYIELNNEAGLIIVPGQSFEESIRKSVGFGRIHSAIGREEEWIDERIEAHKNLPYTKECKVGDNWLEIREEALPDGSTLLLNIDVTQRKEAEQQVLTLSRAVEQSPASVVITDTLGNIEYVNPKFTEMTGYEPDEVSGRNPRLLKTGHTPAEEYQRLWTTITGGGIWTGEFLNKRRDGSLFWESAVISGVRDNDGKIIHYLGIKEDITERKRIEEMLRQSQKMEAVGQLTSGIAHDFNNILGIVTGNLELLERGLPDDAKLSGRVQTALKGARRGAALTKRLLQFSRPNANAPTTVRVNISIAEMKHILKDALTNEIDLELRLAGGSWPTLIDPGEFDDAVFNLVINALDAMPNGGKLVIETSNERLSGPLAESNPAVEAGEYVVVSISDNGTGMSQATRDRMFDPFFTTKPLGKGTGLGMSMVYGFVTRSKGGIKIDTEPGQGTTIRLYLPRDGQPTQQRDPGISTDAAARSGEMVLVVDNEEALVELAREYLEELGYRTLGAENGPRALEIIEGNLGKDIDILFSDVVMPGGLSGHELAARAVKRRPGLKVLLTSGCSEPQDDGKCVSPYLEKLLPKPYDNRDLACWVRRILDDEGARDG